MYHGAILRTDRLLGKATATAAFSGDAICVFTTDGIQLHCNCMGQKGDFYKHDKKAIVSFYADAMDMLGEKLYELLGREALIRLQNATILRMQQKNKRETGNDEKNV